MQTGEKGEETFCDSQNFCLKLSQNTNISDTYDVSGDKDVIVISDTSSKSPCSTSKYTSKSKSLSKKHSITDRSIYIVDSLDSDSTNDENERYLQTWKKSEKFSLIYNPQERKDIKRNKILYTSDESSSDSIEFINRSITKSSITSSNYVTCTTGTNAKDTPKENIPFHNNIVNNKHLLSNCISSSNSSINSKNSNSNVKPTKTISSVDKIHNRGIKKTLSRQDTKNIIKNIRSTRIVYESPKIQKKNVPSDEEVDNNIIHPAILPEDNLKANNVIIDETPVDSESDIIQDSQVILTNLYKTHVNRFFNTPHVKKDLETECIKLSDRKKKQISQWLMENSPDSQSDNSFSIVPPSNKNDISSGNSSLERLEVNYETPNNREKIRQQTVTEKRTTNIEYNDNKSYSTVPRQTTINEFVHRTKDNTLELHTPKRNYTNNNMFSRPTNPKVNTPQNVDIMDCADILDKLYGKSWRDKADALFSKSEPRQGGITKKDRAVQTERKIINRGKLYVSDSDDDSNASLKDLKLQNSSRKKIVQKNTKQRDDFINDHTSSESGSESLYYTALTNPRASTNATQSKPTNPPIARRLISICDTDTEDETNKANDNHIFDIRKRKLSFSNDESEDSDTSEFDPGDDVLPKSTTKGDLTKILRQIPQLNIRSDLNSEKSKHKKHSFLASLSESVPIDDAHPDAKKYRLKYKSNKESLCNYLYQLYNEKVFDKKLPEDMSIEWNVRMRGTAGYCYNKKSIKTLGSIVRSSRIVLATKILDTPDRLRDTLIHEMCHAAAWLINGVSDGHGPFWIEWANKVKKTFPELPPIRRCHDYKIKTKFTYKCVDCGYSIGRHSKSLDIEKKRCGHCHGRFELLLNKTTKSGIVQVQTPKREPSAFALYVKENYSTVKKERNIKHTEVMKILGQQFSAIKIAKRQESVQNNADTSD